MNNLIKNAAGRLVPVEINGETVIPYKGVAKYKPEGRKYAPRIATCADYPDDGNKVEESLKVP